MAAAHAQTLSVTGAVTGDFAFSVVVGRDTRTQRFCAIGTDRLPGIIAHTQRRAPRSNAPFASDAIVSRGTNPDPVLRDKPKAWHPPAHLDRILSYFSDTKVANIGKWCVDRDAAALASLAEAV